MEQGVELVAIKELLGHGHIAVTVYAHVRLRLHLQRDAIDALDTLLGGVTDGKTSRIDGEDPPPLTALVR